MKKKGKNVGGQIEILPTFTDPHVISSLYKVLFSVEHKTYSSPTYDRSQCGLKKKKKKLTLKYSQKQFRRN